MFVDEHVSVAHLLEDGFGIRVEKQISIDVTQPVDVGVALEDPENDGGGQRPVVLDQRAGLFGLDQGLIALFDFAERHEHHMAQR